MATEGIFCIAELGWGKTFLVFRRFLRAYVPQMGGVILGAKAEDLASVREIFEAAGASDRLVVLGPRHKARLNWFDALVSIAPPGAETEEVVGALSSLMEVTQRSGGKSDDGGFFKQQAMMLLSAAVDTLRLAGEPLTAGSIYRFVVTLPSSGADLASDRWRGESFANECVERAMGAPGGWEAMHTLCLYLFGEMVALNDRTRSSIVSTVSSLLSKMLRGWVSEVWSTTTTFRIGEIFGGKWLYLDTSPLEYGEYGAASLVMAKHLTQRAVMRRTPAADSRPVALFADEVQNVLVKGADREYQAVVRGKLGCSFSATQNVSGLSSTLGGGFEAENEVKSWLALYGMKLFGSNSDWPTCTYCSELCGSVREALCSETDTPDRDGGPYERLFGEPQRSSGLSEQYQPAVRPERLVGLRKPLPPGFEADAVVVMARLVRVTGRHWAELTLTPEGRK